MLVYSEGSVEVQIMASTSHASRKSVEDTEIFQVLEESTDSDVTILSSEEDEEGNEPDSDEDGQQRFKKLGQYLHLNDEEERPDQQRADFDILYKARPA